MSGMFLKIALRDATILAAVAALWALVAPLSAGSGAVADLSGLAVGLGVGAGVFLLHEGRVIGGYRHDTAADRPAYRELAGEAG